MKMHPKVTPKRIREAVFLANISLENPGFCMACGAEAGGVEPDARGYECEACGEPQVYGAEELLMELSL
ncbi:MAG TPA: hypothetical protein VK577_20830 [Bradyrhizobium sp.]|nr:hypothetical protein [Bradyrhizobium sp.]